MTQILLVGLGGFLGAISRFLFSGLIQRLTPTLGFPLGTLAVNVVGCFLIGLLNGLSETRQLFGSETRLFVFIGLLGGFTTYSTFGYETIALLRDGELARAVISVSLHLIVGLGAVWIGDSLGRLG